MLPIASLLIELDVRTAFPVAPVNRPEGQSRVALSAMVFQNISS
jgi:hypothetical protein